MSDDTKASRVPLVETLRNVPLKARQMIELGLTHHQNIPYGRLCHEAASTIERLERGLAEARSEARRCRASVDVAHTLPVSDDALPFTCCCCQQTHYMAPVSAKATPLRRPMSQGGGIVYDPNALAAENARLREALRTLVALCDDDMGDDYPLRCLAAWAKARTALAAKKEPT